MGWETVVVFLAIVVLFALFLAMTVAAMVSWSGWVSARAERRARRNIKGR